MLFFDNDNNNHFYTILKNNKNFYTIIKNNNNYTILKIIII